MHEHARSSSQASGQQATVMTAEDKDRPGTTDKQPQSEQAHKQAYYVQTHTQIRVSVEW